MPRVDTFPTDVNNPFQIAFGRMGKQVIGSFPATKTILSEENGATFLFDRAAGIVFTLPAPVVGLTYDFIVLTSVTSNSYKIITSAATIFLQGQTISNDTDSSGAAVFFAADPAASVAVTMNGTTTGGLKGTKLRFTCVSATQWNVEGVINGSGTVATSFAAS